MGAKNQAEYTRRKRERYQSDPEYAEKIRARTREQYKAKREEKLAKNKEWYERNPHKRSEYYEKSKETGKRQAQEQARYKLPEKKSQCGICGDEGSIERHHKDYSKPLEIIYVCHICHHKLHRVCNR